MKKLLPVILLLTVQYSIAQSTDTKLYELRIYYCEPGRLDALISRFQNHTTALFEKHGMTNVGYWLPVNNEKNALYYVLSFPDEKSREASWKAFINDPAWQTVRNKSEESGKIITSITSILMKASDFSPLVQASQKNPERVFELRTYYCHPGKLSDLNTRFRNHTLKLFEKHGMTNVAYWETIEKEANVQPKLVYILAHKSEEAGKASFDTFRKDPEWMKVASESEKGGKIVEKIESVYMKPLAFSAIK
ncbi:MAG: NIPSNAP family protein [Chitinophagaceae bacterium]|nr:NIPSNAP family protein [Chitinophagaceae bacterium]